MTSPVQEVRHRGGRTADWLRRALEEVASLDHSVSAAVLNTETPALDGPISRLSNAADGGWLVGQKMMRPDGDGILELAVAGFADHDEARALA